MKSAKCSACGFVGWPDGACCKSCGATLLTTSQEFSQSPAYSSYQPWESVNPEELKKGLAKASLVVGIISFLTLSFLGFGAVLGTILASIALSKRNREPLKYGGKEHAIAGLVLSITSFVMIVPVGIIAAIAIPNLLAARAAANEGSSIASLRTISAAEHTYYSIHEKYGTLYELADDELINPDLATGVKNGYNFKLEFLESDYEGQPGFEVVATPITYPSSGRRSFYIDVTGVIRGTDARGAEATRLDSPLNFDFPPGYSSSSRNKRNDDF